MTRLSWSYRAENFFESNLNEIITPLFCGCKIKSSYCCLALYTYLDTDICCVCSLASSSSFGIQGNQTTQPADNSDHKRGLVEPYEKTTRTINNYCCLSFFYNKIDGNHKDMCNFISRILIDSLAIKNSCLRLIKMSSNSCQLI